MRADIEEGMSETPCPACGGRRLKPSALAVTVGGLNIAQFTELSVVDALRFLDQLNLSEKDMLIAAQILKEIRSRLGFLQSVGLGYLTLARTAATLSGGESQRIRLATQIGSSLMGVLYILDEPSIGLHQRDNAKLLRTLQQLRDLGNTLIVVEHDEETMRTADYVVDIGPGAGINGGKVVAQGSVEDICAVPESVTGQYLSGRKYIPVPETRRIGNGHSLWIRGASENNLKNLDVEIPLGIMTAKPKGAVPRCKDTRINCSDFASILAAISTESRFSGIPSELTSISGASPFRKSTDVSSAAASFSRACSLGITVFPERY